MTSLYNSSFLGGGVGKRKRERETERESGERESGGKSGLKRERERGDEFREDRAFSAPGVFWENNQSASGTL